MQNSLKPLAFACKIMAILEWLGVAWVTIGLDAQNLRATSQPMYRDAPADWGTPAYYHRTYWEIIVIVIVCLIAMMPNRWLISSRTLFYVSLFVALTPLWVVLWGTFPMEAIDSFEDLLWPAVIFVLVTWCFSFLPLSLIFSFWRQKKGQTVTYA